MDTRQNSIQPAFQEYLRDAASQGRYDTVDMLLRKGCQIDEPTIRAAIGKRKVFKVLLTHGLDINRELRYGGNALIMAVRHSDLAFMCFLLGAKADPNACTSEYAFTALEVATQSKHNSVLMIQVLQAFGARQSSSRALCMAAGDGNTNLIRLLLDSGATIDEHIDEYEPDLGGGTALHWAAQNGELEAVRLLMKAGARIDLENSHGMTAEELASLNRETLCAELLKGGRLSSGNNYLIDDCEYGR